MRYGTYDPHTVLVLYYRRGTEPYIDSADVYFSCLNANAPTLSYITHASMPAHLYSPRFDANAPILTYSIHASTQTNRHVLTQLTYIALSPQCKRTQLTYITLAPMQTHTHVLQHNLRTLHANTPILTHFVYHPRLNANSSKLTYILHASARTQPRRNANTHVLTQLTYVVHAPVQTHTHVLRHN